MRLFGKFTVYRFQSHKTIKAFILKLNLHIYIYIYIYIKREKEREREREGSSIIRKTGIQSQVESYQTLKK